MILLKTTDILRFRLSGAVTTNQLDFVTSFVDITGFSPSNNSGTSNDATNVTIIGSPSAGVRQVKFISIVNVDTTGATVTVEQYDGVNARQLLTWTLDVYDTLSYVDSEGWKVLDAFGKTKVTTGVGSAGNIVFSAGTQSAVLDTVIFSNSNRVSFGLAGSTITAKHALNFSAGTTSNNVSDGLVFSNSNGVSFGLNGSTITASVLAGGGGYLSAGTQTGSLGTVSFKNTNNVSFGMDAQTITASVATSLSNINVSAGTTSNNLSAFVLSNSNNVTFGLNGSTITASVTVGSTQGSINVSGGTTSGNLSAITFSNSNGVSFGLNAGTMTASVNALSNINISAGTTSNNLTALTFNNSNGITFGLNASTITASHNGLTTAMASDAGSNFVNTSAGLNLTNISATFNSNSISLAVADPVNTAGLISAINVSAGTTSNNLSAVVYSNSNNATFGLNGSTVTISSPISLSAGTTNGNFTNVVFSNSNNVSFGLNDSTITASISQTNQNISFFALGNTTQNSSTVLNASQISFNGLGELSVGFSNGSINLSANVDAITAYGVSNTTQGTSGTLSINSLSFNGAGGISVGISNGSIVISSPVLSTYEPYPALGLSTVNVGIATNTSAGISVFPFYVDEFVSAGVLNIPFSMNFLTVGTSSGQQTIGLALGLYSRNVSTLSSIVSTSFSIGVTGNNSSYTINQPTTTAYTGYNGTGATNSAGSNITSGYTGQKLIQFPINTLLTVGDYWLAMIGTKSTSSVNVGLSMSYMGAAMPAGLSALAPIGSFSSGFTTGFNPIGGRWNIMQGLWTSAGSVTMIPASMAHNSISATNNMNTYPLMKFWST